MSVVLTGVGIDADFNNESLQSEEGADNIKEDDIIAVIGSKVVSGRPTDSTDQKPPKIQFNAISGLADDVAKKYAFRVDRTPAYLASSDADGIGNVCI